MFVYIGFNRILAIMVLGIVFSVCVSILFSLYVIPRKFSKQSATHYAVFVGFAFFIVSAIWYLMPGVLILGNEKHFGVFGIYFQWRAAYFGVFQSYF